MMKRHCLYLLLCLLSASMFSACSSDDDNNSGQPPVAAIRNLSDQNTCAVGESLHFKAGDSAEGTAFTWMVDGTKAGEGDSFTFQASAEGLFKLVLQATNTYGTDADTLNITVTAPRPPVDFSITGDILNWTGEGKNQSALAIQWVKGTAGNQPTDEDIVFLAWGYRWDDSTAATGMDMLKAVAKNDSRLFVIMSEGSMPFVYGLGYDYDNDGRIEVKNGSLTLTEADFTDGIYFAKSDEDYDSMTPTGDDLWLGGQKKRYASYYIADKSDNVPEVFTFSREGFAQRPLKHLSWDAWTFSSINSEGINVEPRTDLLRAASPKQ